MDVTGSESGDMVPTQAEYAYSRREEVLPFIPNDARTFLDVGCSAGGFGAALRDSFGPEVSIFGVEPVAAARTLALSTGVYEEVYEGYFPDAIPEGRLFDCVIFNDVLEHMIDPWATLKSTRTLLTANGKIVASVPNIVYLPTILGVVLRRRWDYRDSGVLDRTHLRFFARENIVEMFEHAGFDVLQIQGINNDWGGPKSSRVRWLTPLTGQFQWMQYVAVGAAGIKNVSLPQL